MKHLLIKTPRNRLLLIKNRNPYKKVILSKIVVVLLCITAALLSISCKKEKSSDYYNHTMDSVQWFSLGDTIYTASVFNPPTLYHANFAAPLRGLCRDPLCTHSGEEITCPDHEGFIGPKYYCTDGKRIYFNSPHIQDPTNTGIYSVNLDGTELRLLTTYDRIGYASPTLCYYDGYLYYQQCVHEENSRDSVVLMQISVNGGTPKACLPMYFDHSILHCVDHQYIYILDCSPYYDYERSLTFINRKNGEIMENVRPEGYGVESVQVYGETTYIICAECIPDRQYDTLTSITPLRIYRFQNGETTFLADSVIQFTFSDNALWYTTLDVEYYGTVMSPTGKGNETAPLDIIRNSSNILTRIDLIDDSAKTKAWTFDRFDESFTPRFYGISEGIAIVSMSSQKLLYQTGDSMNTLHRYQLHDDGTVTDLGTFEK